MPETIADTSSPGDVFENVSVSLRICVGTARPTLQELVSLQPDAIMSLDRTISDDVELFVGERLVARGVLEEDVDTPGQLQVRVTAVGSST